MAMITLRPLDFSTQFIWKDLLRFSKVTRLLFRKREKLMTSEWLSPNLLIQIDLSETILFKKLPFFCQSLVWH